MTTYYIGGVWRPAVEIEFDGPPTCIYCGDSPIEPSMDGPLVCSHCDMGVNKDGSRKTEEQIHEQRQHFATFTEKYRKK